MTGIQNYAEGVARLFGADARCEVIACAPRGEDIAVDWRLSGSVRVGPGATIKPYVVHTTFRVRDGLVVFQEDAFSIPGWQILLGVLLPGLPIPEAAPPVEAATPAPAASAEGRIQQLLTVVFPFAAAAAAAAAASVVVGGGTDLVAFCRVKVNNMKRNS